MTMDNFVNKLVELIGQFKDSRSATVTCTSIWNGRGYGFNVEVKDLSKLEVKDVNGQLFIFSGKNMITLPMLDEEPYLERFPTVGQTVRVRLKDGSHLGFNFKPPKSL